MDGNGRWAKKKNLPRIAGHRAGAKSVEEVIKAAQEAGVKILGTSTDAIDKRSGLPTWFCSECHRPISLKEARERGFYPPRAKS